MEVKQELLIYLLEDDEYAANFIKTSLNPKRFQENNLIVFTMLSELMHGLLTFTPDIILLDLNVPDSKGADTILKIASFVEGIPIVVISGVENKNANSYIQYGAQDFIPKSELTASLLIRVIEFSIIRNQASQNFSLSVKRDHLTRLYNRDTLFDKLDSMLNSMDRYQSKFAVCYLKVRGMTKLNNEHGHKAGDTLLSLVGNRLQLYSRASDFVARYIGNEYVTIFPNISAPEDAISAAISQLKTINDSYMIKGKRGQIVNLDVVCNLGLVICKDSGLTNVDLLEAAALRCTAAQEKNLPYLFDDL